MTKAHDQSEFTILFQSLLNTKGLCNFQLSEMKLNGPESPCFFARLQLLASSCSIQRPLKLLIKSPIFRRCPPKCHTGLLVNLCTMTAEVIPTSCRSSSPCRNRVGWTTWKSVPQLLDCDSMHLRKLPTTLFYPSWCISLWAFMVQEVFKNSLAVPTTSTSRAGQIFKLKWITVLSAIKHFASQKTWNCSWLALAPSRYE